MHKLAYQSSPTFFPLSPLSSLHLLSPSLSLGCRKLWEDRLPSEEQEEKEICRAVKPSCGYRWRGCAFIPKSIRELAASSLGDPRSPHGKRLTAFLVRRSLSNTDFGISKWDFYYSVAPCLLPVRSLQREVLNELLIVPC